MSKKIAPNRETRFKGLPISEGVAFGRICLLNEKRHSNLPVYRVSGEGEERERARLENAITLATGQLERLIEDISKRVGKAEANIFLAQKLILLDATVKQEMLNLITNEGLNTEVAVSQILDGYETRIQELDTKYIKERASDIGEVRRRLLDALRNMNPALQCADSDHCHQGRKRIIIAEELTPSLTVELDAQNTIAFVTERGGPTSHAAILARALGIPAISGIDHIHSLLTCGTEVLVDGDKGKVIAWPSDTVIDQYADAVQKGKAPTTAVDPVPEIEIMANISLAPEVSDAIDMRAEGIGLYRTEFELIAANRVLDEEEQFERYASVVRAMNGLPTTFRLLDVGGDKGAPFLDLPEEHNPYLGFRGARFLLARPELLRTQARALARASRFGPVRALYPMIVDEEQFLALKKVFLESVEGMPLENLSHGVMFEVPSACLSAASLFEVAEFGSIGANDLVQYLFAVDRDNEFVAADYRADHPVFWSLIADLVREARLANRPLSVCGEAANDPVLLKKFMDIGIKTISVSARMIPDLRKAVRKV